MCFVLVGLYVLQLLVLFAPSLPEWELPLHSSVVLFVISQKCINAFVLQSQKNHVKGQVNYWPARTCGMLMAFCSRVFIYVSALLSTAYYVDGLSTFFSRIKIKTYSKFSVSPSTQNPTFLLRLSSPWAYPYRNVYLCSGTGKAISPAQTILYCSLLLVI